MAGLLHAVSGILNDSVLTFLNRAQKVRLGPISRQEVRVYYANAFEQLGIACAPRMLEAGVIESPRRGELTFAVPLLADYLRHETA